MKIEIRQFEPNEIKILQQLMHELGYPLGDKELLINLNLVQQKGGIVLVAKVDGDIAGCISAAINAGLAEGLYGEIISLVVFKNYRGIGVGKQLVVKAEDWLKSRVKKIRVRANSIRVDAHGFYKSLGYQEIKTQISFIKTV
ncbi:MAG: GNAT family N-acetyltransferase [Desulfobacterales bacterium]|nr:GNAT family N-acetyltransferase [Deltaproteobacteria bacterium]NNL43114.1 GNAT family N-acetyltransferase [Desulfobacterales bacterium]